LGRNAPAGYRALTGHQWPGAILAAFNEVGKVESAAVDLPADLRRIVASPDTQKKEAG
jgi:hypothetical protein